MDDLVQWLRAVLDTEADEAQRNADAFGAVWTSNDAMESVSSDTGADVVSEPYAPRSFIAEHDPARVLREIDAKRRILAQYVKAAQAVEELDAVRERLSARGQDTLMTGLELESAVHRRDTLQGVLRLHAAVYSDRPGYREEWAP